MATPTTSAIDLAPIIVGFLSTAVMYLFHQPLAVVVTAAGGALWAVWRKDNPAFRTATGFKFLKEYGTAMVTVLTAAIAATILVELAVWLLSTVFGYANAPVRALAGLIGFVIVDKTWRDKFFSFLGIKFNDVEVKND